MPRTVIYDLKGAFGTLRKINALYDVNDESSPPQALWYAYAYAEPSLFLSSHASFLFMTFIRTKTKIIILSIRHRATTIHRAPALPESPYTQSLNAGQTPPRLTPSSVRFFSDYSRVFYHPRSVVQLHEHELHSSIAPFERHATGEELFAALDREHDLLDRDLRPFVEEADHMQAVQVFAGFDDAWGGFAGRYVERVRDEYGKVPLWVWGLQERMGGVTRVSFEKK
jgi:hypothetical protein